jgi:hypothetical protein
MCEGMRRLAEYVGFPIVSTSNVEVISKDQLMLGPE